MTQKFSIVIPTMWRYTPFVNFLKELVDFHLVDEIILIDNDSSRTPTTDDILSHEKIKYYNFGKNIFVNPAWNFGVSVSKNKHICILNDDVDFDLRLFSRVNKFLNNESGVLGLCPGRPEFSQPGFTNGMIDIVPWNGIHTFGFGCLMFIHKDTWIDIPNGLDIYFGDNWIFDTALARHKSNYLITNMFHYTPYASTTKEIVGSEIMDKESVIYKSAFDSYRNSNYAKDTLTLEFLNACNNPSDINEHVATLYEYASKCEHVTEMGVRPGTSTRAFLHADVILRSYDLVKDPYVEHLFELAKQCERDVTYEVADTLNLEIEETDLLFIDTDHFYKQLSQELKLHGNKAMKYLVFHDTVSCAHDLLPAIMEFLAANPHWSVDAHYPNNNGVTVLKRLT